VRGIDAPDGVIGPVDAFALRNPDMYLAGSRVNMVSAPEFLAEQVPGMTTQQVEANEWWAGFTSAPDRIGWWLAQEDPPGESSSDVARRLERFARSFADPGPHSGRFVVCVTHSPLLRSMLRVTTGEDPGEPGYVTGALVRVGAAGQLHIEPHDPLNP
jgi:broad specificity phosphatase PhoE